MKKRRMMLKPVLLIELLVVAMLVGVGSAYAITINPMNAGSGLWLGQDTVADGVVVVDSYDIVWSTDAEATAVILHVTNTDAVVWDVEANATVGDGVVEQSGTGSLLDLGAGLSDDITVTLAAPVPAANVVDVVAGVRHYTA